MPVHARPGLPETELRVIAETESDFTIAIDVPKATIAAHRRFWKCYSKPSPTWESAMADAIVTELRPSPKTGRVQPHSMLRQRRNCAPPQRSTDNFKSAK